MRWRDKAPEVHQLSLSTTRVEVVVKPVIKPAGPAEIITVTTHKKVLNESGAGATRKKNLTTPPFKKHLIGRI